MRRKFYTLECTGYPGWRKIGDNCYYVSPDDVTKTWHGAQQYCTVTHNAHLPSIHSTEEMLQLNNFVSLTIGLIFLNYGRGLNILRHVLVCLS